MKTSTIFPFVLYVDESVAIRDCQVILSLDVSMFEIATRKALSWSKNKQTKNIPLYFQSHMAQVTKARSDFGLLNSSLCLLCKLTNKQYFAL